MTEIRNILLIGRTGTGKSTLANVLVNKKVFKESAGSTSETKHYQRELVDINGKKYGVVDTIGLGDTKLSPGEVYSRLAEAIREFFKKDGINRVIFTTDGRFTQEEIKAFASLQLSLFDDEIVKHCTIIRTKFPEFNNEDKCDEDIRKLRDENPELKNLVDSIGPMNIIHTDADQTYEGWEEDWKGLNKKLWNYLEKFEANKYLPKGMEDLNNKIDQLLAEERKKQENLQSKIDGLKEEAKKAAEDKAELEKKLEDKRIKEEERKRLERELAEVKKKEEEARKENERTNKEKEKLTMEIKNQQGEILKKQGEDSLGTFIDNYGKAINQGIDAGKRAIPLVGGFVGGAIALAMGLPFAGVQFFKSLFWS